MFFGRSARALPLVQFGARTPFFAPPSPPLILLPELNHSVYQQAIQYGFASSVQISGRGFAASSGGPAYSSPEPQPSAPPAAPGQETAPEEPPIDPSLPYEYFGPWGRTAVRVKRLSIFSAAFTFITGPLLVFPPEELMVNHAPFAWKVAILGTMYTFTCFTTAILHWYTKPYIHALRYDPSTRKIEVLVTDFWTRKGVQSFSLDEAEYADSVHPYAQFKARGRYYQLEAPLVRHPDLIRGLLEIPRPGADVTVDLLRPKGGDQGASGDAAPPPKGG